LLPVSTTAILCARMNGDGFTRETLAQGFSPGLGYGMTFVLAVISAYAVGMFAGPHLGRLG
jgi:hypothetical protein